MVENLDAPAPVKPRKPTASETPTFQEALPARGERLSEGVARVRAGEVHIEPGYDGRYGTVKIWGEGETADAPRRLL